MPCCMFTRDHGGFSLPIFHLTCRHDRGGVTTHTVPRIYEIWSRRAPTFIWPIRPVCQCRSLTNCSYESLRMGKSRSPDPCVNCPYDCKVGAVSTKFRRCEGLTGPRGRWWRLNLGHIPFSASKWGAAN